MQISTNGWRRNTNDQRLLISNEEIADAQPTDNTQRRRPYTLFKERTPDGRIRLSHGPATLTLNGDYGITVELTQRDVLALLLECFPEFQSLLTLRSPPIDS